MSRLANTGAMTPLNGAWRALVLVAGALATAAAAALAAVLAVVFTATVVMIALIASVFIAFLGLAVRARKTTAADPDLIEARNIGGHSWVAYGHR